MPFRINCIFLVFLCLTGFINVARSRESWDSHNKETVDPVAGSGGWALDFSDDEDLMDSGSGSGSGMGEFDTHVTDEHPKTTHLAVTATTIASRMTDRPLTDCESNRQTSQSVRGKYAPRCLPNGDFDSLQCHGHTGTAECWCSDLHGREIPGTLMEAPNYPSCDDGSNLPPCVYQLVKHKRSKLLGSFQPKCTVDGQFDLVQCHGSVCFCVDESTGSPVSGTEVHLPDRPKCGDDSAGVKAPDSTNRELPDKETVEGNIDIDDVEKPQVSTPTVDVRIDQNAGTDSETDKSEEVKSKGDKFNKDNKTKKDEKDGISKTDQDGQQGDKVEKASDIMSQPGILAGIIGGSVVLLLCLVLLIMFLIYRMRKKDEGSYPLDEPRKAPNYNYVRAPDKEFYA